MQLRFYRISKIRTNLLQDKIFSEIFLLGKAKDRPINKINLQQLDFYYLFYLQQKSISIIWLQHFLENC